MFRNIESSNRIFAFLFSKTIGNLFESSHMQIWSRSKDHAVVASLYFVVPKKAARILHKDHI